MIMPTGPLCKLILGVLKRTKQHEYIWQIARFWAMVTVHGYTRVVHQCLMPACYRSFHCPTCCEKC